MAENLAEYDSMAYRKFTRRSELDKILNTLIGILKGITMDDEIKNSELEELKHWCNSYRKYKNQHPFNELFSIFDSALEDNILSTEEAEDIFWLISRIKNSNEYYNITSTSLQELQGILHGILADNLISDKEIHNLRYWMDNHDFLKGLYPYDEIDSLIMSILQDGIVTEEERDMAKAFFGEFIDTTSSLNIHRPDLDKLKSKYNIKGICAACPEISFEESTFCFTGVSNRAQRKDAKALLDLVGGTYSNNVTKNTDYLIVGAGGNPCWVFSCYGRKVETAVNMRKTGHKITILHENDLWDELIPHAQDKGLDYRKYLTKLG